MAKRKTFWQRYRQLGLWRRVAFWGSVSSIAAFVLAVVVFRWPSLESEEAPLELDSNEATQSIDQTIISSPGAIQAGRDVILAADPQLIRSMELRVAIETRTDPAPPGEEQFD